VLVDAELTIVQFRGNTEPYLAPAPGEASLDLLKMVRKGLTIDLRAALHKARRTDAPVGVRVEVRDGARSAPPRRVGIEVLPLVVKQRGSHPGSSRGDSPVGGADQRWFLVLFQEDGERSRAGQRGSLAGRRLQAAELPRVAELERELATAREYLQATLEEQEATHEELQSANEELLTSNEELQSINEELETAREEQEATHGELVTLNNELRARNAELHRQSGNLGHLLASLDLPIVVLGVDLAILRFTPAAGRVLRLIPSDVGRPLGDLNPGIDTPDLEGLVTEVIATVVPHEREVRGRDGRWHSLRIQPFVSMEDEIEGAVLFLVDVDRVRRGLGHEPSSFVPPSTSLRPYPENDGPPPHAGGGSGPQEES
jgi:two-component system CheB/CheR fusion protein